MKKQIICCVAGKSGGHIIPCLTLAEQNSTKNREQQLLFFSSNTPLDKTILSTDKNVTWHIELSLATLNQSYIKIMFNTLSSFFISFFYLCKYRPEKIITTGGIVAIPPCIAGFILRIPIIIYSLDAVPGKAIRAIIPLAQSIFTCFASAQHYFPAHKTTVADYPIKYIHADNAIDKHYASNSLGLSTHKKTVVILGGSQGSLFLNTVIKELIINASFNTDNIQCIHQTGSIDTTDWNTFYKSHNITAHVFSYRPDLTLIYAAADLIICRAGAGTLFEIKFFNKPCIIIPLSTATTTHQIANAHAMTKEYPELFQTIAQNIIEQNPEILLTRIFEVLH